MPQITRNNREKTLSDQTSFSLVGPGLLIFGYYATASSKS